MKKYVIFSVLFIGLLSLFVYMQSDTTTTFNLFGVNITLLNAVWVGIFLSLFFILSLIFFGMINLKNYFFTRNVQKDRELIIANIKNRILFKDSVSKDVKVLNELFNFSNLIHGLEILPQKIDKFEFLEDLRKIKEGEWVDLKKYKLKEYNKWVVLNTLNRIKKDKDFAKDMLLKTKNEEIKKAAFYAVADTMSVNELLQYDYEIPFDIVKSHVSDKNFHKLLERVKLTPRQEIEIARSIHQTLTPEEEFERVKPLKWASAYLALKYEHLDLAREIIEENDLKYFEFFLKLREAGIKAEIDEYVDSTI
jgi:hypothetical protein